MQKEDLINNLISIWQDRKIMKELPAEGKSMYPLVKTGDKIHIRFCRPETLKIGDIVVFRRGDITIVHRLLKKLGTGVFLEKGDFQIKGLPINSNRIFGKALVGSRYIDKLMSILGYIIHKASGIRPLARFLLILPFTINVIINIIKKYRNFLF